MHISRITRHRLDEVLPYIFIILMVISILFFQITHQFFVNGIDSFFHMSVTYDTYRQLKSGNFSYFLSAYGFYHSLRIVNAVYGPLGGYFSGFLLLITGSWIRWEIASFFIVFTIAGISMYQLCRYWHVSRIYSVFVGGLYMFSFPIMSLWQNSQYDGWGAIFMPWVLYFGSLILNHESFKSWKLVILLVILAEIHIFSLLLALVALGLCFGMALVINYDHGKLILKAFKILLLTAILSFNVWGGIFEVLGSNHNRVVPTYSVTNLFQDVWGSIFFNPKAPISQNFFLLSLATSILLVITAILYLFYIRELSIPQNFIMVALGFGFLWLSTRLCPWPFLQQHFPILDTDLQFPKRFLPVSLSAFGVMLGILLTKLQHHMNNPYFGGIVLAVILGMFVIHAWQNTQYQMQYDYQQQSTMTYYDRNFFNATRDTWVNNKKRPLALMNSLSSDRPGRYFQLVTKGTPDYLPTTQRVKTDYQYHHLNAYYWYNREIVQNRLPCRVHLSHHVVSVTFNRRSTKPITLPFVKYANTHVVMNGRSLTRPRLTQIGALNVKPKAGRNVLKFKYIPSLNYRLIMGLSIIVWLLFLVNVGREIFKHHYEI